MPLERGETAMTIYVFEHHEDEDSVAHIISKDEFLNMTADELREAFSNGRDGWIARTKGGLNFVAGSGVEDWVFVNAESEAEAVAELRAGRSSSMPFRV
jgi:hypothetical protein